MGERLAVELLLVFLALGAPVELVFLMFRKQCAGAICMVCRVIGEA